MVILYLGQIATSFMISPSLRALLAAAAISFSIQTAIAQTWEVYDLQGNLKSRAIYDRVEVLGESVLVGKNKNGLAMLSRDLKPVLGLQGDEVYQYLAPWILVKGPKGIGAFHEYGQQAFPLEYEQIQTYFNLLLAQKGNEYWLYERGNGRNE